MSQKLTAEQLKRLQERRERLQAQAKEKSDKERQRVQAQERRKVSQNNVTNTTFDTQELSDDQIVDTQIEDFSGDHNQDNELLVSAILGQVILTPKGRGYLKKS
jgi:exonuclease VII large subunit